MTKSLVSTAEATLDVFHPAFKDRIISRRADVVWPPRSCDLTPLGYYLWGVAKDKCYADKPETNYALRDNIRKAIGLLFVRCRQNIQQFDTIEDRSIV